VGFLRAGQQLASVLTRIWWPASLLAAVIAPRLRVTIVAAATIPALLDWMADGPCLDPLRYLGLWLLDDVAYGAGVWSGAWSGRDLGALVPRFARQRGSPVQQRSPLAFPDAVRDRGAGVPT
jgi:hypothetical protein